MNETGEDDDLPVERKQVAVNTEAPWREMFMDFIQHLVVNTKDYGDITLAEQLFGAQRLFLDEICDGLEKGQRHFVVLKARQLGISTIALALIDIFWLAYHPGMQGALITDTAENLGKFREIIAQLLKGLPKSLKIKLSKDNRNMLVFGNGSMLDFVTAGVKEKGKGKAVTLGTSRAYNVCHGTELGNWGDSTSYGSLMASLSEHHPDRLYLFESTGNGYNLFYDVVQAAQDDPETQRFIFIGWWAKESYSVEPGSALFARYWDGELTKEEQEKSEIVQEQYGVFIKPEQWAWYRWKKSTRMSSEGNMEAQYPFHAREAFVETGKGFFSSRQVNEDLQRIMEPHTSPPYEAYLYNTGEEFINTSVEQLFRPGKEIELRVWEYPNDTGYYAIGVDVAYGRDEMNDRSVIQIFRCFADKMVQVAEYASTNATPNQLAWIICHLAGNYKQCMLNIEVNGPGMAVKQELDHLKMMLKNGYLDRNLVKQPGLKDFFNKARYYLYHRPDSMGAGFCWFWKTNTDNKQIVFNQFRDLYMQKQVEIKSKQLLMEMQKIIQEGSSIHASSNNKDDICMATTLAVKAWIEFIRTPLINQKKTQENDLKAEEQSKKPYAGFIAHIYKDHMKLQQQRRQAAAQDAAWAEDGEMEVEDAGIDVEYEASFDEGEDLYG